MVERKPTIAATGRKKVNLNLEAVENVDMPHPKLDTVDVLTLADEQDPGGDPYNSTGQFCNLFERD